MLPVLPARDTGFVAVLNPTPAEMAGWPSSPAPAATLTNSAGLRNQEYGGHVYVCAQPRKPWEQLWPAFRHYD